MAFLLSNLSNIIIPVIIFYIVAYGVIQKTNVYEDFVKGAGDGLKTVVSIMPTLVALMTAVGVLRASGFLNFLEKLFRPLGEKIGFPAEIVPLTFIKMFSSSAATGLVLDILKLRHRFLYWSFDLHYDELYGNYFLYHERIFPGGKGDKDQIYACGGTFIYLGGNCSKCGSCRDDVDADKKSVWENAQK